MQAEDSKKLIEIKVGAHNCSSNSKLATGLRYQDAVVILTLLVRHCTYQECDSKYYNSHFWFFSFYHKAELFSQNFGRELFAKLGRPKWRPVFQAMEIEARNMLEAKSPTNGLILSFHLKMTWFYLQGIWSYVVRVRTIAPGFSTAVLLSTRGSYNMDLGQQTLRPLAHWSWTPVSASQKFDSFHITFLYFATLNGIKQYITLSLNICYIIKYKYEVNSFAL